MAQTVRTLETGIATPELGAEAHSLPCEVVGSDAGFTNGICILGFSKMDTEGQESHQEELVKRHYTTRHDCAAPSWTHSWNTEQF